MSDWRVFRGDGVARPVAGLGDPPPWRRFLGEVLDEPPRGRIDDADPHWTRAKAFQLDEPLIDLVNAALTLRRPILITGNPGTGKSTLIHRVAYELGLGPALVWPINSRSTLGDGLYEYDALARLRDQQLGIDTTDIGRYITLGPLGTALLPSRMPRALLIDEIDKADIDLPNDLLNVFEEGYFDIPELARMPRLAGGEAPTTRVGVASGAAGGVASSAAENAVIRGSRVQCREFPFVVMTSNRERDFPPAFLRRCLRITMPDPDEAGLTRIVTAHLGEQAAARAADLIRAHALRPPGTVATDQLLNAVHLVAGATRLDAGERARLSDLLLQEIARKR